MSNVPAGERDVTVTKDDLHVTKKFKFQRGHSITYTMNLSNFEVEPVKEASKQKASAK